MRSRRTYNSTITDDVGDDWAVYHGRFDGEHERKLMMDKIELIDGWPVINGGNGPSRERIEQPVVNAK